MSTPAADDVVEVWERGWPNSHTGATLPAESRGGADPDGSDCDPVGQPGPGAPRGAALVVISLFLLLARLFVD